MKVLDATFLESTCGMDGVIRAVGLKLDAPVVSADAYRTHEETRAVVGVEEY